MTAEFQAAAMVDKPEIPGWERQYPFLQKAPGALVLPALAEVPFTREMSIFRDWKEKDNGGFSSNLKAGERK